MGLISAEATILSLNSQNEIAKPSPDRDSRFPKKKPGKDVWMIFLGSVSVSDQNLKICERKEILIHSPTPLPSAQCSVKNQRFEKKKGQG